MTDALRDRLTEAVRSPGGWCTVHLDLSGDRENPEGLQESRRRSVRDRLLQAGADEGTASAVDAALSEPTGLPGPITRYLLARGGEVAVDEAIPGRPDGPESVVVGPLPDLAPLIRAGVDEFAYLVVQVSRDGGEVAVHRTGAFFPESTRTLTGSGDVVHKAASGGWSQLNRHEHVEEVWKRTQAELSHEIDRTVQEVRPRLVVVAGDLRARGLLLDALGERSRSLAVEHPKDTRSDGSDGSALAAFTGEQVAEVERRERLEAVDLLRTRLGQQRPAATRGLPAVVEALRQGQADTVFIDAEALADETVLALEDVPWVAETADDAGSVPVIGRVPALSGLVRAALLTDARILLAPQGELEASAAALLRWPADVPAPV